MQYYRQRFPIESTKKYNENNRKKVTKMSGTTVQFYFLFTLLSKIIKIIITFVTGLPY